MSRVPGLVSRVEKGWIPAAHLLTCGIVELPGQAIQTGPTCRPQTMAMLATVLVVLFYDHYGGTHLGVPSGTVGTPIQIDVSLYACINKHTMSPL